MNLKKVCFWKIVIFSCICSEAYSQIEPYHIFEYDTSAAHFEKDSDVIPKRILRDGVISGDITFHKCRSDKKYLPGLRFLFRHDGELRATGFTVVCNSNSKNLYMLADELKKDVDEDVMKRVSFHERKIWGYRGEVIPFSIKVENNRVRFEAGGKSKKRKLKTEPTKVEVLGIGSKASVRFYAAPPES